MENTGDTPNFNHTLAARSGECKRTRDFCFQLTSVNKLSNVKDR